MLYNSSFTGPGPGSAQWEYTIIVRVIILSSSIDLEAYRFIQYPMETSVGVSLCAVKTLLQRQHFYRRMHSSSMRTARSSSHRGGVYLSACWYTPPGCGPGDTTHCGPGDTPQVWAWRPPWPEPSTSPLDVGLETCKAC